MSIKDLSNSALISEMRTLSELPSISAEDNRRLGHLTAEYEARQEHRAHILATATRSPGYDSFNVVTKKSNSEIFHAEARGRDEAFDLAQRAAEVVQTENDRIEFVPSVKHHLRQSPGYADQFRATSDPAYASAFGKLVAAGDAGRAMLSMTDEERAAMQRVAQVETRAMSEGTDSAGGYLVPTILDVNVAINNNGTMGRVRDLATVVTGIGREYEVLNSAGITAEWLAEGAEAADGSPTIGSNTIEAHRASSFVPVSLELAEDTPSLLAQLRQMMQDSKDRLENAAFINGSGTGQPHGLVTRLEAATSVDVAVSSAGAIVADDVYNALAAVPARYRSETSWMTSLSVTNEIRSISDDKLGNFIADLSQGYGFNLLGRPVYENSEMPDLAATAGATLAVVGDLSNYVIFDRAGSMRVELVNHLFGSNDRPTGQRGVFAHWRVGGDVRGGSAAVENGMRLMVNP